MAYKLQCLKLLNALCTDSGSDEKEEEEEEKSEDEEVETTFFSLLLDKLLSIHKARDKAVR